MAFDFPSAPTLGQTYTSGGATYTWNGYAWILTSSDFVKKSGDTMSGNLELALVNPRYIINALTDSNADISWRKNGITNWLIRQEPGANSGGPTGAVGSDLSLMRFDNSQIGLPNVMTISRATGIVNFLASPTSVTPAVNDNSIKLANTAYVMGQVRLRLTAPLTIYVRADGNDGNSGLADNSAGAKVTIAAAIALWLTYDNMQFATTITVRAGTYAGFALSFRSVGGGTITVQGDGASTVTVNGTITNNSGALLRIGGIKLVPASGASIQINRASQVFLSSSVEFGASTGHHVAVGEQSYYNCNGITYTITGTTGGSHFALQGTGSLVTCQSCIVTLSGSPVFPAGFCGGLVPSSAIISGTTFSGSTGAGSIRYSMAANSVCQTFGSGANYLPGDTAGVIATGGQYI